MKQLRGANLSHWLRWHGSRAVAALGLPGLAALALLLCAITLRVLVLPQWQAALDRLGAEVAAMRRDAAPDPAPALASSQEERLRQVLQSLPPFTTTVQADALARLHDGARSTQLELAGASYQLVQVEEGPIARLDVTVQTRGNYPQLRGFAIRLLQAEPAWGLNAMRLSRSGPAEPMLDAEFSLSLFMRTP